MILKRVHVSQVIMYSFRPYGPIYCIFDSDNCAHSYFFQRKQALSKDYFENRCNKSVGHLGLV